MWGAAFVVDCDRCSIEYTWLTDDDDDDSMEGFLRAALGLGWVLDRDDEYAHTLCPQCAPLKPAKGEGS